ncbi:helix-turn-helix domain-containing protein [Xanthomonas populi]|uniref:helix-turn-helix domain-containing protein n=1 Tax=Xanthomonas populi TaxID=53414 RepID=UPI00360F0032
MVARISARHAQLILLLAEGMTWAESRAKLDCGDRYINRWRKRLDTDAVLRLSPGRAERHGFEISGTARCRCTQRSIPRPVTCWARLPRDILR